MNAVATPSHGQVVHPPPGSEFPTPEVVPHPQRPWPRPPWWTGPWPPQPPNPPWRPPPWVSGPPWGSWCGPADWRTTEEAWWWWGWPFRARQQWAANPWAWCGAGLRPGAPDPWWGWVRLGMVVPQGWNPSNCFGCRSGWPFDVNFRHIGPIPLPSANRWDCNQVKWLGRNAPGPGGASLN